MSSREWVCEECGRRHPKHSPPCSRCGSTVLTPTDEPASDFNERAYRLARLRNRVGTIGQLAGFVLIGWGLLRIWMLWDWLEIVAADPRASVVDALLTFRGTAILAVVVGIVLVAVLTYPIERYI